MNTVFDEIVNKGEAPTRADIARLLASIAEPSQKRDEKQAVVRKLYEALGHSGNNSQGHHVADSLVDYEEF
jgi:hypothetical protein